MVPVYVTKDGSDSITKTIIINYNLACVKSPKMFKNKMCKLKICSQILKIYYIKLDFSINLGTFFSIFIQF